MIEMQMRHDQMRDVAGFHPECAQMIWEPAVAMIENLPFHGAEAIADSSIDQDRVAALHYKRARQVKADTVAIVGRMIVLPQFARYHAEHASAVIAPQPGGPECHCERADIDLRWYLSHLASSTSHQPRSEEQRDTTHRDDCDVRFHHSARRARPPVVGPPRAPRPQPPPHPHPPRPYHH